MSYDIYLVKEVDVADVGNQTYNTSPMFTKALDCSLRDFDGKNTSNITSKLLSGIVDMVEHSEQYKVLNPENGWGSYESALAYLVRFYKACIENPETIVKVS